MLTRIRTKMVGNVIRHPSLGNSLMEDTDESKIRRGKVVGVGNIVI